MSSSSSSSPCPSHDHEPKNNDVYHRSLQHSGYPSFRFLDYSNPIQNELKNPSSTTNDAGKQQNNVKKIVWFFSYSVLGNHKDVEKQNKHTYSCDVCNKVFTSNKALHRHKICHAQESVIHPQTASQSSFEQSHIDCSKYLPPISYKTKKRQRRRRRRYMNTDDDVIAAETLLHISRGGYGTKRQKLSCNMMDDDEKKKKEQGVLLTSGDIDETLKDNCHNEKKLALRFKIPKGKIFQTSQDCKEPPTSNHGIEEKMINEGVTELGPKVVKNFDLNELPSDDFEDETN
ncbi:putative transcription factor C2H2 family [Medicago truncatula]|uniref:Putative transcription factor C2H2 family n=1 Tax=Medicago truncatula TaxID=3880 RepID=A0A396GS93_MEDTR|nr:putative transcription factor C2H2 family [Medicago truncatula]